MGAVKKKLAHINFILSKLVLECETALYTVSTYGVIVKKNFIHCRLIHQTNHDLYGPLLVSFLTYGATPSLPTIKTVLFSTFTLIRV